MTVTRTKGRQYANANASMNIVDETACCRRRALVLWGERSVMRYAHDTIRELNETKKEGEANENENETRT